MRFLMLVVIAVATGALSMTAMQTLVPQNASMFEAVRAFGGDPANFKFPDINPVKAYHDVIKQIKFRRPVPQRYVLIGQHFRA